MGEWNFSRSEIIPGRKLSDKIRIFFQPYRISNLRLLTNSYLCKNIVMKSKTSSKISSQAAGFLKLAGVILFLVSLVNIALLFFPFNLGDVEWQIQFTSQIAEQGIIPILAIALMFCAYGLEDLAGVTADQTQSKFNTLKFWVYLISTILGVIYLLLIPLHVASLSVATNQTIERANQEAEKAKKQVSEQLQLQQTQMLDLLQNNQKLEEYVASQQLTPEELERLEEFKKNPEALKLQASAFNEQFKRDIEERRQQAEIKSKQGSFKSGVRIGLTSLLLASCYLTIGWSGLTDGKARRKTRR